MRVLIIHHVQACWAMAMYNLGVCPGDYDRKVCRHLRKNEYDRVLVTNFDSHELEPTQEAFREASSTVIQVEKYNYGWCVDDALQDEDDIEGARMTLDDGEEYTDKYGTVWVQGCAHSEIVPLPEWMQALSGHDVYLLGAFDGECITTISCALHACGVKLHRINKLIIG